MRRRLVSVIAFALALGASSFPAQANPTCVTYSESTPAGTIQGQPCVPLPSPFNFPVAVRDCEYFPPLENTICIGVSTNIVAP